MGTVKGIGPKRAALLRSAGLATVEALAGLSKEAAAAVAAEHGLPIKTMLAAVSDAALRLGVETGQGRE